jgi:hypothetical protein
MIGDKLILRTVARSLGLEASAKLPKRAVQFGSRLARQSNKASFANKRAAKGDAPFVLNPWADGGMKPSSGSGFNQQPGGTLCCDGLSDDKDTDGGGSEDEDDA